VTAKGQSTTAATKATRQRNVSIRVFIKRFISSTTSCLSTETENFDKPLYSFHK
jgi:hypothetical protein